MADLHVVPIGDLIDHDTIGGCACGPAEQLVKAADGSTGWLAVHHTRDSRAQGQAEG
nr:hypothetical protein [Streptomyces lavendulae]